MAVLDIPSDIWPNNGLSDARIFFCVTTLAGRRRARSLPCERAPQVPRLQALIILPLASLPWPPGATTSRWLPSCSWPWCWRSVASRSRSGIVLGIASAMKFTAWPLAVLALFAARNRKGERKPLTMLAGLLVVAIPTIFPFALRAADRAHR